MVLALVRPSGVVRNFAEATDVLNVRDIDAGSGAAMTIGGTNATTITIGRTGQTVEFPGTVHLLNSSVLTGDGDVTLGDGDGDVITFGGAFVTAADIVNIGTANVGGDTIVNLNVDMTVADTKDIRFVRTVGSGVMVLPSTSTGEAGAVRVTAAGQFEWWNGAAWVAAGSSLGNTLQQSYDAGTGTITLDASGDFIINMDSATAGDSVRFASSNGGADYLLLTSTGANAMSLDALVTTFAASASSTMDLDAAGALSINSSAGVINIGDDAVAQNIYVGTGASARTITLGNAASTEVEINAIRLDLNAGANGFQIDGAGISNVTTSAGALTITSAAGATWSTAAGALTLTSAAGATWSTGAGALTLQGFTDLILNAAGGELTFNDSYRAASTYVSGAMPFANATAEWSSFVTNFGDGTSLIAAVNTAYSTGSGFVATCTAGTTLGYALGGSATDNQVENADADSATLPIAKCFGFAGSTVGAGAAVQVKNSGLIAVTSPAAETWARGDMIYLSTTAGLVTKTAPSGAGNTVQCVGYAAATDGAPGTAHTLWAHITIPTYV